MTNTDTARAINKILDRKAETNNPIDKARAMKAASAFRRGAEELTVALQYAVQQALNGNADGFQNVCVKAGLSFNDHGTLKVTKTAEAVASYWRASPDKGGLGMGAIMRFDSERNRWVMRDGWKKKAERIDLAKVWANLARPRGWLEFKATKAKDSNWNLDAAVLRLVKSARKHGKDDKAVQAALAAALLQADHG